MSIQDRIRLLIAELYVEEAAFHEREGRHEQAEECRRAAEVWMRRTGGGDGGDPD